MKQIDPVIERIGLIEKQKLNTLLTLFYKLEIQTTREYQAYARRSSFNNRLSDITFSPLSGKWILYTLSLALLTCIILICVSGNYFMLFPIIGIGIILTIVSSLFKDKDLNYTIYLDEQGITIKELFFHWDNIYDTAITSYGPYQKKTRHLLIIMKDESYRAFELSNFSRFNTNDFSATLSKYIEHFKSKSNEKPHL